VAGPRGPQALRLVATRLRLPAETWTTRIELIDTDGGGTRVTMALACEPRGGSRLVERLQGRTRQRLVQRTLDAELEKVPAHIALAAGSVRRGRPPIGGPVHQ
jgi:hypothetical protein